MTLSIRIGSYLDSFIARPAETLHRELERDAQLGAVVARDARQVDTEPGRLAAPAAPGGKEEGEGEDPGPTRPRPFGSRRNCSPVGALAQHSNCSRSNVAPHVSLQHKREFVPLH